MWKLVRNVININTSKTSKIGHKLHRVLYSTANVTVFQGKSLTTEFQVEKVSRHGAMRNFYILSSSSPKDSNVHILQYNMVHENRVVCTVCPPALLPSVQCSITLDYWPAYYLVCLVSIVTHNTLLLCYLFSVTVYHKTITNAVFMTVFTSMEHGAEATEYAETRSLASMSMEKSSSSWKTLEGF